MKDKVLKNSVALANCYKHEIRTFNVLVMRIHYQTAIAFMVIIFFGLPFSTSEWILHYHERDLARSLILLLGTESKDSISDEMKMKILGAAAFH
ncbi:hypothetical protein IEQ34_023938 [Dendrobium chrysotoxum]|uniref:Uncharacterized protein n=1 Tax=Dendrobium chrysotoxum TaxID=161865 RepID=A0AAV7FTB5_DENCH|nr:hypothetical protein IEQ34_023938 [Dendrobium chrysotoxum]